MVSTIALRLDGLSLRFTMKIVEVVCQILRIESIERKTAGTQDTVILRIRTDTGLEGIGEADA